MKMSSTFAAQNLISQNRLLGTEQQSRLAQPAEHGDILDHQNALSKMHLQINYEGRVRVLPEKVFSTLDDSEDISNLCSKINTADENKEVGSTTDGPNHPLGIINGTLDSIEQLRHIYNNHVNRNGPSLDSSIDGDESPPSLFQCHLCSFTSNNREDFNSHVNNHYEFHCPKCDFMTKIEVDYRNHLKDEHGLTPEDLEDDQGVRVPHVNSQGKVKALKCKQCEYVTVTKDEFWRHCKGHIKPEKLLTCPKCMFVTEYKHHLEYHLRNHFGSKPFKCPQCNYSCVNKSMLNSHMKSHTTIHQYRCKDCNYATKYCHSLKLHLRKYGHKPAMVLNPDGTPNPLPIVDVYGTRRGPKIKRDEQGNIIGPPQAVAFQKLSQKARMASGSSSQGNDSSPTLLSPYMMAQMKMQQLQQNFVSLGTAREHSFPSMSQNMDEMEDELEDEDLEDRESHHNDDNNIGNDGLKDIHTKCSICNFETTDPNIYRNHMILHATRDMEGPPPIPNVVSPGLQKITDQAKLLSGMSFSHLESRKETLKENPFEELPSPSLKGRFLPTDYNLPEQASSTTPDYIEYLKQMAPLIKRTAEINQNPTGLLSFAVTSGGLSLSPPPSTSSSHPFMQSGNGGKNDLLSRLYLGSVVKNFQQRETTPMSDLDSNTSTGGALDLSQNFEPRRTVQASSSDLSATSSVKSRRKGQAYKIERKLDSCSIHSGGSSEPEDSKSEESGKGGPLSVEGTIGSSYSESDSDKQLKASPLLSLKLSGNHICQPCQIAFMDSSMYLFHQECHDQTNPLKCTKCGQLLGDAKDFYIHLIKESHK